MGPIRHLLLFAFYGGTAIAAALLLQSSVPAPLPTLGPREAWLIGGLVFLLGLLLHEVTARLEREAWLAGQILALQRAHTHAGMELRRVGDEAVAVRATMESRDRTSQREVGHVVAEVKVLQSLIDQL